MKLRILNGGHSLIGLVGDHLGHQYVHESVKDLRIAELYNRYMIGEVIPSLDPIVDTDYIAYSEVVRQRFSNALIRDTNARIISDSSGKFPKFILPVISFNLRNGGDIALGSLIVVAWWIYLRKMVELDKAAAIQDPLRDVLAEAVDKDAPIRQFLQIGAIFGDLADQEAFVGQCETYVARLQEGTFEDLILENINT